MKTVWKLCLALALMVAAMFAVGISSFAAEGPYTVSGNYKEKVSEELNVSGITFQLFEVGHFNGPKLELNFDLPEGVEVNLDISKDDYVGHEEDWIKKWLEQAQTVADNIPTGLTSLSGVTDESGAFIINGTVGNGLYLLVSNDEPRTAKDIDGKEYVWYPRPMLVMVLNDNVELTVKPLRDPFNKFIVRKIWKDKDHEDVRPSSIDVEIYYNYETGEENKLIEVVELNKDNSWTYSWSTKDEKYRKLGPGRFTVKEVFKDEEGNNYLTDITTPESGAEDTKIFEITNIYKTIKIVKKLPQYLFGSEQITTTFAFKIEGYDKNGNVVYQSLRGASFDSDKEEDVIEIDRIPWGTIDTIKVTELYSGGAYKPTGDATQTASWNEETEAYEVEFKNKYDIPVYNGGIVNRFTLSNDGKFTVTNRLGKFIDLNEED